MRGQAPLPPVAFPDTFPPMPRHGPVLYLDLVDPGSLVMLRRVRAARPPGADEVELLPFEVRPPPDPLLDPHDPAWTSYWKEMAALLAEMDVSATTPTLVPWTRKAHELVAEAAEAGVEGDLVDEVMLHFIERGHDIGRVDVLLPLAQGWGLDLTRTKAALDVDRHAAHVEEVRRGALEQGVRGVPTLVVGARILEGVHDETTIRRHLEDDRRDT